MKNAFYIFIISLIALTSCNKPEAVQTSGFQLAFSTDTVLFDTVFTSLGSSTRQLRIKNTSSDPIRIKRIALAGGDQSFYRLNIDGVPGNSFDNYELLPNDSLYIFVDVTIDPNNQNNPLIVTDSILFMSDDKVQDVDLVAWGQDAYFYGPTGSSIFYTLPCNYTITADKPHVFYGYAVVDSLCQLDVDPGARLHFHANSGLIVYRDGTLKVNGQKDQEVIFEGDRLEPFYENAPGQWGNYRFGGIWCSPGSRDNEINYAIVRNGIIGIHADTLGNSSNPTLKISNTIVENMSAIGVLGQGTDLEMDNSLVRNIGKYALLCNIGGDYRFRHCTFANYWSFSVRQDPSVVLNNYYEAATGDIISRDLNSAFFSNCIVWGSADGELFFDESADANFNPLFEDCLILVDSEFDKNQPSRFTNTRFNVYPRFIDPLVDNFLLDTLSPAQNKANSNWIGDAEMFFDLKGDSRYADAAPDIGCYERVE